MIAVCFAHCVGASYWNSFVAYCSTRQWPKAKSSTLRKKTSPSCGKAQDLEVNKWRAVPEGSSGVGTGF